MGGHGERQGGGWRRDPLLREIHQALDYLVMRCAAQAARDANNDRPARLPERAV
jgi:hypothetical protein